MSTVILPPNTYGVDSVGVPNFDRLIELGYRFKIFYVGGDYGATRRQVDSCLNAGMVAGFNFERQSAAALGGSDIGKLHATTALRQAPELGWSYDCEITFSGTDFDVQPHQYSVCDDYVKGAMDVISPEFSGFYAGRAYLRHLETWVPPTVTLWEAGGWARGPFSNRTNIKQYVGFPSGKPVRQSGSTPDPTIGCLIDENRNFRNVRFYTNQPTRSNDVMFRYRNENGINVVYELGMGYKTSISGQYFYGVLGGTIYPDETGRVVAYPMANSQDIDAVSVLPTNGPIIVPPHTHTGSVTVS